MNGQSQVSSESLAVETRPPRRLASNEVVALLASALTTLAAAAVAGAAWFGAVRMSVWLTPLPFEPPKVELATLANPEAFVRGKAVFAGTCSTCHGPSGEGLPNSGKPLLTSEFVKSKTDAQLVQFIKGGRPVWDEANTSGVDMPPRGGNPLMTDENIEVVVVFLRGLEAAAKK